MLAVPTAKRARARSRISVLDRERAARVEKREYHRQANAAIAPKARAYAKSERLAVTIQRGIAKAIKDGNTGFDWESDEFPGEITLENLPEHKDAHAAYVACMTLAKELRGKPKCYKVRVLLPIDYHYVDVPLGNNGDGSYKERPTTTTVKLDIEW